MLKEMVGCEECLPNMQIRGFDSWKEGCIEESNEIQHLSLPA